VQVEKLIRQAVAEIKSKWQLPTQNPKIFPLVAITNNGQGNKMDVVLFVSELNSGDQFTIVGFQIDYDSEIKKQPNAFVVDWSNQDVPDILKSQVIMRLMDNIVLESGTGNEMVFALWWGSLMIGRFDSLTEEEKEFLDKKSKDI
jgi:hypothetical protein